MYNNYDAAYGSGPPERTAGVRPGPLRPSDVNATYRPLWVYLLQIDTNLTHYNVLESFKIYGKSNLYKLFWFKTIVWVLNYLYRCEFDTFLLTFFRILLIFLVHANVLNLGHLNRNIQGSQNFLITLKSQSHSCLYFANSITGSRTAVNRTRVPE